MCTTGAALDWIPEACATPKNDKKGRVSLNE